MQEKDKKHMLNLEKSVDYLAKIKLNGIKCIDIIRIKFIGSTIF